MQSILEDLRTGEVSSYEIPEPELRPGGILIHTAFSAISAGTERAKIEQGSKSLLNKAMSRPDLVRQVIDFARSEGIKAAYQRVQNKLDTLSQLGYSCAGTVIAVGSGVSEFRVGDRVACAGGGYANHSQINFVPQNLAVKVPEAVPLQSAALTTIGAIAVQGLRQSGATFGETVAVIGAGLMGVLTIQLARAAGCRVIAIDLNEQRIERAKSFGAELGLSSADPATPSIIAEFTSFGVDAVIITAATPSADPLELAAKIARDRAKIVIVGDVGMGVSREHMYHKELSIVMSRSYGPGRYDPQYEEQGVDYPIGHVRWTERRNMESFLALAASGALKLEPLIAQEFTVDRAAEAYAAIKSSGAYTVVIRYPEIRERKPAPIAIGEHPRKSGPRESVRAGCIGAGSFARNIIFPALQAVKGVHLQSVASASGVAAQSAKQSFGFAQAQSASDLVQDRENDILFVISQHDSHARYVESALANHKAVFVEKPLATTREDVRQIMATYEAESKQGNSPFVMVGFNRRFAPLTQELCQFFKGRVEPMVLTCRINAGFLPGDHWVNQQGGRVIGEMCHFIDWARAVVGSPIASVFANVLPDGSRYHEDNMVVTMQFRDGSIANLLYLANGDKSVPKEWFEVFCAGAVATIDDFSELRLTRGGKTKSIKSKKDKGHSREIQMTIDGFRTGQGSPIPFGEILEVTEATFAVLDSARSGAPVTIEIGSVAELRSESTAKLGS